jgi:hypothetical protein
MTRARCNTSTQAAAAKATAAADTVMEWLRSQPRQDERVASAAAPAAEPRAAGGGAEAIGTEPETILSASVDPLDAASLAPVPPSAFILDQQEPHALLRLAHPDWLHHRLQITGPASDLAAFRVAAAGAGTVPWQLDLERMEEDLFHLLVAPPARTGAPAPPQRSLSLAGARILAAQLCTAVARRHALALSRVGHSRACAFDLHALVPVPEVILRRGPDDPLTLGWLWSHWGTTQPLRHVAEDEAAAALSAPAAPATAVWTISFWSADWTPWRALAAITADWPTLRFAIRPSYSGP